MQIIMTQINRSFLKLQVFMNTGKRPPKNIKILGFFFIMLCLVSCGLVNLIGGDGDGDGEILTELDSRGNTDSSIGTFNISSGPLTSEENCFDSDDCVTLCDSMLAKFSDQKKCYDYTEKEVQSFRDIYNLLAIGIPERLERVEPEKMEFFLEFSPVLWNDAIYGFVRGAKGNNCVLNLVPTDPRDRETCKLSNYYVQKGYWSEGAAATLEWIARNDWLAALILEHDENHIIMEALLDILFHGGKKVGVEGDTGESYAAENGDIVFGSRCRDLAYLEDRIAANQSCGDSNDEPCDLSLSDVDFEENSLRNRYSAFGVNCLNPFCSRADDNCDDSENYFILSARERNINSVNLGYQILRKICDGKDFCIKYFYCHIKDGTDGNDNFSSDSLTVFYYYNKLSLEPALWNDNNEQCDF